MDGQDGQDQYGLILWDWTVVNCAIPHGGAPLPYDCCLPGVGAHLHGRSGKIYACTQGLQDVGPPENDWLVSGDLQIFLEGPPSKVYASWFRKERLGEVTVRCVYRMMREQLAANSPQPLLIGQKGKNGWYFSKREEDWRFVDENGNDCLPVKGARIRAFFPESWHPDQLRDTYPVVDVDGEDLIAEGGNWYRLGNIDLDYAKFAKREGGCELTNTLALVRIAAMT